MSATVHRVKDAPRGAPYVATGAVHPRQPGGMPLEHDPTPANPTQSALEEDRWAAPINAMYLAASEAVEVSARQPDEQRAPSMEAMLEAFELLSRLPTDLRAPAPVVEPDGTVAWEWYSPGRTLVLAVNGRRVVQHSSIIYGRRAWGENALDWQLPREVLQLLGHFPDTNAAARAVA